MFQNRPKTNSRLHRSACACAEDDHNIPADCSWNEKRRGYARRHVPFLGVSMKNFYSLII